MKASGGRGIYLYCIAHGNEEVSLGKIGIDSGAVHTIPHHDISAIVHRCEAQPYESEDKDVVKGWVVTHQKVVDCAWQRFGTVLPLAFDTIIIGEKDIAPEENMKRWLQKDYEKLRGKLDKVKDKAEYGVQILWNPKVVVGKIAQNTPEIRDLQRELESQEPGTAYMYEQKVKNLLSKEMKKKADECFKDFYAQIRKRVFDIHIDKVKTVDDDLQMLMNLSCLVVGENVQSLGNTLEEIKDGDGFDVRFTGPWPPYSFT